MKKKIIIIFLVIIIIGIVSGCFIINKINNRIYTLEELNIVLKKERKVEFLDKAKVSDFIKLKEGKVYNNYKIDTTKVGKQKIDFIYSNNKRKYKSNFEIEVVDTTEPIVWLSGAYNITKGTDVDLTKKILCGDNYDDKPTCEVIGEYDKDTVGEYDLVFKATDSSNNVTEIPFTLRVKEPVPKSKENGKDTSTKTLFSEVIANYKTENTEIGIDISKWQGDIDFEALKAAGVEFVIIRVGSSSGIGKDRFVDSKFEQNITKANELGIPVGIYYYSYADSIKRAKEDAEWILEQIKDYKVDLPIAFDWENWSSYNVYNLSFYHLTEMANAYLDVFKDAGYEGMLYSSKSYLETIWFDTDYPKWLAHYVKNTSYIGDYSFWQMCSNGRVDGIKGDVDIDIRYLN